MAGQNGANQGSWRHFSGPVLVVIFIRLFFIKNKFLKYIYNNLKYFI
jgi:hypothetical protein